MHVYVADDGDATPAPSIRSPQASSQRPRALANIFTYVHMNTWKYAASYWYSYAVLQLQKSELSQQFQVVKIRGSADQN